MRLRFPLAFAACAVLAQTVARADVLVEIGGGDKVLGSLVPASEVEAFSIAIAQGSKLSVAVKGKKSKGAAAAVVGLRVYDTSGGVAAEIAPSRKGAKFSGTLGATGAARIEVTGDGVAAGDYLLSVKLTPPKKIAVSGDLSSGEVGVSLSLDRGFVATVKVGPGADSDAQPRVARLDLPPDTLVSFTPPLAGSPTDVRVLPAAPATRDYVVYVTNAAMGGGSGGASFVGTVTPRAPKPAPKRRLVDLRASSLGQGGIGGSAEGFVIGPEGGLIESSDLTGIPGAAVQVPPGALGYPTPVILGSSSPLVLPGGAQSAGPAVFFGPDGLTFDGEVSVTLPFDPAAIAGDVSRLVVYVRDSSGAVSLVAPPYAVDAGAGLVTFPTSHFSDYVVAVRGRSPHDLNGDGIDDLVVGAPGFDGGRGAVHVFFGSPNPPSGTIAVTKASATAVGDAAGRSLGRSWAVGDFDADGFADLAVGVGQASTNDPPEIRIYRGGPGFAKAMKKGEHLVFAAATTGGRDPGRSLAAGDVTGDGIADLVVGAPSSQGGRVHVLPGAASLVERSLDSADVPFFQGSLSDGTYGQAVLAANVTGDLTADVIVGAPDQFGFGNPTRAVIYQGGSQVLTNPGFIDPKILSGFATSDGFGEGLAAGDYDGDGDLDLFVGGWRRSNGIETSSGAVYVFDGPIVNNTPATSATFTTFGLTSFEGFGRMLALLDTDPIGTEPSPLTLYASAESRDDGSGSTSGAISILEKGTLSSGDPPPAHFAGTGNESFGHIHPPIDWNGDGRLDLVVGAPNTTTGDIQGGSVRVYLGPSRPTTPRVTIVAVGNGSLLGLR